VLAHWLVLAVWNRGSEPDNIAIPYVTAFGDLIGTGLLALGFVANTYFSR
jgi:solute carrier family 41